MSVALAQASAQFGENVVRGQPRSNDGSNHANDSHYNKLRQDAQHALSKHMHFAAEASKAYNSGDKAQASAYSSKSKEYKAQADKLNDEAASWVFMANNTDSAKDEIDLHGLFVKEAIVALDARVQVCRQYNQPVLKAIVGKGLHSETHISKLRPAVLEHCQKVGLPARVDHSNPGVVIIEIAAGQGVPQGYSQPQGYGAAPPQNYYQGPSGTNNASGFLGLLLQIIRACF